MPPSERELLEQAARIARAPEPDCVYGATPYSIIKALVELANREYAALFKLRAAVDGVLSDFDYLTECKAEADIAIREGAQLKHA